MNNSKKWFVLMMVVALILSSCGQSTTSTTSTTQNALTETTSITATETTEEISQKEIPYPFNLITYTFDNEERTVTFEKSPQKVYVDGENNIDIMLELGLGEFIIGACNPGDEAKAKLTAINPDITFTEWQGSKETVISMEPDFILAWYGMFHEKSLGSVDYWHESGVNTYMSLNSGCRNEDGKTVVDLNGEFQDILNIGKIFNKEKEAQAIVDNMQTEIDKVKDYTKNIEKNPSIAILEWGEKGYRVYGNNSLAGDMAIQLGATLAMGAEGNGSAGAENIIEANPEVIVMVTYGSLGTEEEMVAKIMQDEKLSSLQAIQNNRVYAVDLGLVYSSGLKTKEGIQFMSQALYPDLK